MCASELVEPPTFFLLANTFIDMEIAVAKRGASALWAHRKSAVLKYNIRFKCVCHNFGHIGSDKALERLVPVTICMPCPFVYVPSVLKKPYVNQPDCFLRAGLTHTRTPTPTAPDNTPLCKREETENESPSFHPCQ